MVLTLALTACTDGTLHTHGGGEAGHDHGEDVSVHTHYTEFTELFLEFEPLVAGRTSVFAAHVTKLDDFRPLTEGVLDVVLEQDGRAVARFRVQGPARPGLFTPGVAPRDAGQFELAVEIVSSQLETRHELGPITVFASSHDAHVQSAAPDGDVEYLKEQQWAAPFASAPVRTHPMRPSVPGHASVRAPGGASAEIRAPADGYLSLAEPLVPGRRVEAEAALGYLVPRLGEGSDLADLTVALARARAETELAEREVERLERLVARGAVPERRLFEAQQALQIAQSELHAARARIEGLEGGDGRSGMVLRAPVAGELIEVSVQAGTWVRAGEPLFRIAAPERRWLEIRVPERYAAALRQAGGAWFEDAARGTVVLDAASGARIVQASTAIDAHTRTASLVLEYPTAEGPEALGSRFAAHVFTAEPQSRLAVPRSAVILDGGRPVVYVQVGGESFARRPVELGIVDGAHVEVLRGLEPGERVVTEGAYYVRLAAAASGEIGHGHTH
jgi:membrane fusion protein, heavy metal efflux system